MKKQLWGITWMLVGIFLMLVLVFCAVRTYVAAAWIIVPALFVAAGLFQLLTAYLRDVRDSPPKRAPWRIPLDGANASTSAGADKQ